MQLKPADILEHLTAALVAILKIVPGVGTVIEYADRVNASQQMRSIFNQINDVNQRMAILEELATMPAAAVERIARRELHGSAEQNAYVLDVVQHITRQVTRKVNSTKRLGAPKLQDDENFYLDLIPTQRPHDYRGQAVPQHPRWILQELIGSGGFGEVWRAQHETLPEQEAIKFCHEEAQREFLQREVNTLKLVQERLAQHPNIVRLKDVNLTQAPYWLAFEYIAGGTLLDVMQQRHLAWGEALHVMTGIVQGVAAAHALGIVHRDLKPANILLTPDGVPKVTDFGLGKVLQQSSSTTNLRMGTENYASPEQRQGLRADSADDVYALGVIFWQLATHTLDGPQYLRVGLDKSRIPTVAKQLLLECLEQPRGKRPANAQALLQRLQQLPLSLVTDAGLNELRQQADQARNAAQQAQATYANSKLVVHLGQVLALLLVEIGPLIFFSQFTPTVFSTFIYVATLWAIGGSIVGSIVGSILGGLTSSWIIEELIEFPIGLAILGLSCGVIAGFAVVAKGDVLLSNKIIALLFVYVPFLIVGVLIAGLLSYFLAKNKSDFFTSLEQIIWVYVLCFIIQQNWYTWMFSGQFVEVLLPMPILIIMTAIVLGLYLMRLAWHYRQLVAKEMSEP